MTKFSLVAFSLFSLLRAQQAPTHYLLTFQLAPGLDVTRLTPEQKAAFAEHGKYLAMLNAKGLVVGEALSERKEKQGDARVPGALWHWMAGERKIDRVKAARIQLLTKD